MKMFMVQVVHKIMVLAESAEEANNMAGEYVSVLDGAPPDYVRSKEIKKDSFIPKQWQDAIPFADDVDEIRTCEEIKKSIDDYGYVREI